MRSIPVVRLLAGAVLVFVAATSFDGALRSDVWYPLAAVTVVVATVVSALVSGLWRRRLAVPLAIQVPVAAVLVGGLAVGSLAPERWRRGLVDGPRLLLTGGLPAGDDRALLAVPIVLVAVAAVACAELTVRRAARVLVVVPPVFLLVCGFLANDGGAPARLWRVGGLVVLAAVVAVADDPNANRALRRNASRRRAPRLAAVGSIVAVSAVGIGCVALASPGQPERFTLRDHVAVPPIEQPLDNPMDLVPELLSEPGPRPVLRVAVSGPGIPTRARLGVLDRYDGERWTMLPDLVPAGASLPIPEEARSAPGQPATLDVEVVDLATGFLVAADRPVGIESDPDGLYIEPATGVLVDGSGRAPKRYVVTSRVEVRQASQADVVADDPEARRALVLPKGMPPEIRALARQIVPEGTPPADAAARISSILRSEYDVLAAGQPVRSGITTAHLRCFLVDVDGCGQVGTRDQFGTAYVLLARSVGLPTRLAIGFPLQRRGADGDFVVSSHDITVWPEVKFADAGWVPFQAVPDDATSTQVPQKAQPKQGEGAGERSQDPEGEDGDEPADALPVVDRTDDGSLLALVASAAAVLLVLFVPRSIRAVRRRRRCSGGAKQRVVGAWQEAVDRLAEAGDVPYRTATASEIVADAEALQGREAAVPLRRLADRVNRASYARRPPTDEDARRAWSDLAQYEAVTRREISTRRRIRNWFRVRPVATA